MKLGKPRPKNNLSGGVAPLMVAADREHPAKNDTGCETPAQPTPLRGIETAVAALREACPHGHPEFIPMLVSQAKLHSDKNHDYAKGGSPLGNFERVGAILALYPGLDPSDPVIVMMIYALKQLDAFLWGKAKGIQQKVEGSVERLGDINVYSGIAICAEKDKAKTK